MKIQESGENYLEAILQLEIKNGTVRSIDIANYFDYSKPSISRAMSILKNANCIMMDENSIIHLTEIGREIAVKVYDRHMILAKFLMLIGVESEIAFKDACRIEHVISEETFVQVKKHMENL